jgi:hypothetical protein
VHARGVFEVGPQPDKTAFHDLVEELAERILELPAAKKNILKKTLVRQPFRDARLTLL